MTTAAHGGGQFDARSGDRIVWIGRVICSRTVAVFALNAGKVRRCYLASESSGQLVPHRVAGQATGVLVLMDLLERFEGAGMRRIPHRVVNFPVALRAGLIAGVMRRGAQDPKQSVAGSGGDNGCSGQGAP